MKKVGRRIFVGVIVLLIVAVGLWQLSKMRGYQVFGELVDRVETADSVVALTFDDGPTRKYTREILAVLDEKGVPATFFLTGREMDENPGEARMIAQAGHQLANHSYSHAQMLVKSPGWIRSEIERTDSAIRRAGYDGPIYFRPPYGKKLVVLPWYLWQNDRTSITWDVEPESYQQVAASADGIVRHVVDNVRPGSIVLLHLMYEVRQSSRDALPHIIDSLHARGYRFVKLREMLGD